jgi:hypothetical protein
MVKNLFGRRNLKVKIEALMRLKSLLSQFHIFIAAHMNATSARYSFGVITIRCAALRNL